MGDEAYLILKTRKELYGSVKGRIEALHSYKVPCVLSIDIAEGNPAFLNWICAQTKQG